MSICVTAKTKPSILLKGAATLASLMSGKMLPMLWDAVKNCC